MEAGKGMGYSGFQVLTRIELPLAVPVILAGVRTALVINVGTAALATYIGGGALGETINSGLKLQRNTALFVGAAGRPAGADHRPAGRPGAVQAEAQGHLERRGATWVSIRWPMTTARPVRTTRSAGHDRPQVATPS